MCNQKQEGHDSPILLHWLLILSQATSFRLLQTERVCRKQCGKRRNRLLQAISPFPSVFKRFVLQTRKKQGLLRKGLNRYIMRLKSSIHFKNI